MKKLAIFIFTAIALFAAFAIGWETSPKVKMSDAYLAYEHFYEVTSDALSDDSLFFNPMWREEACIAQAQIDSVLKCEVLEWPTICDQRDQLSDVIRCIYEHDPEHQAEIEDIIKNLSGRDISELQQWTFSY